MEAHLSDESDEDIGDITMHKPESTESDADQQHSLQKLVDGNEREPSVVWVGKTLQDQCDALLGKGRPEKDDNCPSIASE